MILGSEVFHWTLVLLIFCFSGILVTSAKGDPKDLKPRVIPNNSSINVDNNSIEIGPPTPPVPPIIDVIHGKVNSVVHEIHGSIDDLPILTTTDILPDDSLTSTAEINFTTPSQKEEPLTTEQLEGVAEELTGEEADSTGDVEETHGLDTGNDTASLGGGTAPGEEGQPQDDIPSFSEWAKKHMAEAGRKGENLTAGTGNSGGKLRFKNYASPDCGAKVVAANPEAVSPGAILSSTRDDYMLNPCNVKIWFVVELCEPIQPQRIEVANFELFSSSPRELTVASSDRWPAREWTALGGFTARDERTVQAFQLPPASRFAKYLRLEMHSHYGSEHFCPVSLFRAYGTSEIEILDIVDGEESDGGEHDEELLAERDLLQELNATPELNETSAESAERSGTELNTGGEAGKDEKKNLFGSAKEAVLSMVKKAAEVLPALKPGGNQSSQTCGQDTSLRHPAGTCVTPVYEIVCRNCTNSFYSKLSDLLCCQTSELQCLLSSPFVRSAISESQLCNEIGFNWNNSESVEISFTTYSRKVEYLKAMLPRETIAALCNYLAVTRRKLELNRTREDDSFNKDKHPVNDTTKSNSVPEDIKEDKVIQPTKVAPVENVEATEFLHEHISQSATSEKNTEPVLIQTASVPPSADPTNRPVNETSETVKPAEEISSTNKGGGEKGKVKSKIKEKEKEKEDREENIVIDSLALDSLFPPEAEEGREGEEGEQEGKPAAIPSSANPPTPTSTPSPVNSASAANTHTPPNAPSSTSGQKESVFVRLANKIKGLEVNMSLSSQYLEELSRRYKRQVEELQRSLSVMVEEQRLTADRESALASQVADLSAKVDSLSANLATLVSDRDSWSNKIVVLGQHAVIVLLEVVGFIGVVWTWRWVGSGPSSPGRLQPRPPPPQGGPSQHISRRHSADETSSTAVTLHSSRGQLSSQTQEEFGGGPKRKMSKETGRKRKRRRRGEEVVVLGAGGEEGRERVTPPPPAPAQPQAQPPPDFLKTALHQREARSRASASSQEQLSVSSQSSIRPKKIGTFRRIVKKLF